MGRKLAQIKDVKLGARFWWACCLWTLGTEGRAKRVSKHLTVSARTRVFGPEEWVKLDNKRKR